LWRSSASPLNWIRQCIHCWFHHCRNLIAVVTITTLIHVGIIRLDSVKVNFHCITSKSGMIGWLLRIIIIRRGSIISWICGAMAYSVAIVSWFFTSLLSFCLLFLSFKIYST
jgi:hypothetical protein